jgi:hypothetical protein
VLALRVGEVAVTYDRSDPVGRLLRRERDATCEVTSESVVASGITAVAASCSPDPCVLTSDVRVDITATDSVGVTARRRARRVDEVDE